MTAFLDEAAWPSKKGRTGLLRKKRPRTRWQWDDVRPLVLGALAWKIDGVTADFAPAQPSNLAPSLAGEN
jgi:hypothetical protein